MTQEDLAIKAGVGLRFIRELEQGKETLRMDKVNQVLALFGYHVVPGIAKKKDPYEIMLNHLGKNVHVFLKNKTVLVGSIMEPVFENKEITGWNFLTNNNSSEYQKTKDPKLLERINHANIENVENI